MLVIETIETIETTLFAFSSHQSGMFTLFNDIYRDDETFSKDASRRVAKREAEMKPETYKHPDDSFYGEIDADSMFELIDLGTEGTFMGEGLRYVDLGCGVGKQVAVRWTLYFCVACTTRRRFCC